MSSVAVVFLGVFALISFSPSPPAQQSTGGASAHILLVIKDQTGAGISDTDVQIPALSKNLKTDAEGKLPLDLPYGSYDLTIRRLGFAGVTKHIEVPGGKEQTLLIVLNAMSCPPGPCTVVTAEPRLPPTGAVESVVRCADVPYAKKLPPPGPACEKELFARRGRPFMFAARDGVVYGVSSDPDKHSTLYLWADNRTGKTVTLYSCCAATTLEHIDVFDSDGRRVLSNWDKAALKAGHGGEDIAITCSCSTWVSVPPHTVQLFDSANVSQIYVLPPGRYTVAERYPARYLGPASYGSAPPGLAISLPQ